MVDDHLTEVFSLDLEAYICFKTGTSIPYELGFYADSIITSK